MTTLTDYLADWITAQVTEGGGTGAVFGVSGGVDSAVVAGLCARAFPGRALGVLMPCHSDPQDAVDGALVAKSFGLEVVTVDLTTTYDTYVATLAASDPGILTSHMVLANLKPRLRMTTLYALANERGSFVVGSSNRSELAVGYFTKYGDSGVDLLPLGSLVKNEVWQLARDLGVPPPIIKRPPSAGLWAGQTDEADLGVSYKELDTYLVSGLASESVRLKIDAMHAGSEHKRSLPPIAPRPGSRPQA